MTSEPVPVHLFPGLQLFFSVPLTQVKSLYAASKKNNKENQKPEKEKAKVPEKKKAEKKVEKVSKAHKSIESAFSSVSQRC